MVNLSIIIPHYNSSDSLDKLIETIPLSQEIQIIIIDDNSDGIHKRNLFRIKEKNFHRYIEFYKNDISNRSAGSCRNIGINHVKGKWILFADADDYFVEGFYEILSEYFNTNNDVVFFTPTSVESQTGNLSDRHETLERIISNYIQKQDNESELFLRYKFFVPWSKLINTNFLEKNKIDFDEVIASNDVMFSTKVGHYMEKFVTSQKIIYCVTRNRGSLSVNISEGVFDARLITHINYCDFLKLNLASKDLKYFNLRGSGYLISVMKYRLGIKKMISTIAILKKSKIKVFDYKYLNPVYTIKKIKYHFSEYNKNRKFFTRVQ
ncbi:glycosyltransferase [Alteribacillus sp. JSM 102045]|uniref:glycosyltransferase n=1 Tax=Alteribacillus sp. JSM 102045 TaxID=1562101 RepID=UPI0035BF904E